MTFSFPLGLIRFGSENPGSRWTWWKSRTNLGILQSCWVDPLPLFIAEAHAWTCASATFVANEKSLVDFTSLVRKYQSVSWHGQSAYFCFLCTWLFVRIHTHLLLYVISSFRFFSGSCLRRLYRVWCYPFRLPFCCNQDWSSGTVFR